MEQVLRAISSPYAESSSSLSSVEVASVKGCDVCDGLAEGAVDAESSCTELGGEDARSGPSWHIGTVKLNSTVNRVIN